MKEFFQTYHHIKEFRERVIEQTRKHGYITTLAKRRRLLPQINDSNYQNRSYAERQAVNSIIQGTCADLIKRVVIRVSHELEKRGLCKDSGLLLTIHDELLFEVPDTELAEVSKLVKQIMENICPLKVPLKVKIKAGPNWGNLQEINI